MTIPKKFASGKCPPARQTEAGGECQADCANQSASEQHRHRKAHGGENAGDDHEFPSGPVQAGLRQTAAQRDPFFLLAARLEILQRSFDLFAARALGFIDLAGGRLRRRYGGAAMLGLLLSRQ
jgi:hypothetical protein